MIDKEGNIYTSAAKGVVVFSPDGTFSVAMTLDQFVNNLTGSGLDTRTADARCDIYSLGCSLYRLLTDKPMYEGETAMNKMLAHREKPIPSLCAARPDVPATLDAVYVKMVAKHPDDRYQSMAEVIDALDASLVRSVPAARPASKKESATDQALSAFLSQVSQPHVATQEQMAAAPEETIDRGSSAEDTGDRIAAVMRGPIAETGPIVQSLTAKRPSSNRALTKEKPWLMPAIGGGVVALAIVTGLIVAKSMRSGPDISLADDGFGPDSRGGTVDSTTLDDAGAASIASSPDPRYAIGSTTAVETSPHKALQFDGRSQVLISSCRMSSKLPIALEC